MKTFIAIILSLSLSSAVHAKVTCDDVLNSCREVLHLYDQKDKDAARIIAEVTKQRDAALQKAADNASPGFGIFEVILIAVGAGAVGFTIGVAK